MYKKFIPTRIEDIHPLTIVGMCHVNKFVILKCESDYERVNPLQYDEEICYDVVNWLEENVTVSFGFGTTIAEAFKDYQKRITNEDNL